jgi:hypothetical protein
MPNIIGYTLVDEVKKDFEYRKLHMLRSSIVDQAKPSIKLLVACFEKGVEDTV